MTREREAKRPSLPWRGALAWAALALVLAVGHAFLTFPHIAPTNDLWDYSQEARQLARGEGFTSLYSYPVFLRPEEGPPFPVWWRMPFYAWRGSLMLRSGTPLPEGYFFISIVSAAIVTLLVFFLAAHFHSRRAAHVAAAAAVACPLFLDPYHPGLSQLPVAAMELLVWMLLLRGRGFITAVVAAAVAAVAWYTRLETTLFIPLWMWAAWRGSGSGGASVGSAPAPAPATSGTPKPARAAVFTVIVAGLCVPWLFLHHPATGAGSPIHGNLTLLYTPEYPGYTSSRTYGEPIPGYLDYVTAHPVSLAVRWVKDVAAYASGFAGGLGPLALGLALAGLLLRDRGSRARSLAPIRIFFAAMVVQVAALAALERSPRFLVPIAPLACVAIGIAAAPALERIGTRRAAFLLLALLVGERAVSVGLEARAAARRFPALPAALAGAMRAHAIGWPPRALLLTDVPDWAAWHLDRPALLLPTSRTLPRLLREHEVVAILLSPEARARNVADADSGWIATWDGLAPVAGFEGPVMLPGGARLYERPARVPAPPATPAPAAK